MASAKLPAAGIDLGTSECRIAVWKDGEIEVIPDQQGKKSFIPSYVCFTDGETYFGDQAKKQMSKNLKNTVFDVKQLIGKTSDGSLQPTTRNYWPFTVSRTAGRAQIVIEKEKEKQTYYPETFMSWMLERLLDNAQKILGLTVTHVVMTVPTYFTEAQRQRATSRVAEIARVNLLHVIDDCIAATLAYCYGKKLKDVNNLLVYNMGTYSFQVSVLNVKDLKPSVVCSESRKMLGGRDFDQLMVSHCLNEILRNQKLELRSDIEALLKLYPVCEEAKKSLSTENEATVHVPNLHTDYNFTCKISRQKFEELCGYPINSTLSVIERALSKAKLNKSQIEHVVLVGGSTRIPKLRQVVKDFFKLEELDYTIEPEEAVVYGAAVQGALLNKNIRIEDMATITPRNISSRVDAHEQDKNQTSDSSEVKPDGSETRNKPKSIHRVPGDERHAFRMSFVIPEEDAEDDDDIHRSLIETPLEQLHITCTSDRRIIEESVSTEAQHIQDDQSSNQTSSINNDKEEEEDDMQKNGSNLTSDMRGPGPAVGIDLGTTCSCIAVWEKDRVNILFNDHGNRVTPSYVSFTEDERLVGDPAKQQMLMTPQNTIFDCKRLIGRKFANSDIQRDMENWCFKVVENSDKLLVEVEYQKQRKQFYPEQISSMVLANLKETAEARLKTKVTDAVVTVPAYFNDAQRQATKDAGRIAGLNVLRIINEPTAAAIAYGLQNKAQKETNVLVYDLGGGTFDVTVMTIKNLTFAVRSTCGDTHLGGRDIDNGMVDFYVDHLKVKHKMDITGNHRALQRLRVACEEAKKVLSNKTVTDVIVDNICDGVDLHHQLSRYRFDHFCSDLIRKTLEIVQQALSDAKIDRRDVDDVVLVGGSTRIPKVQAKVKEFFNNKDLCKNVHPEEAVAIGAAIHAAVLHGDHKGHLINEVVLHDVIPMSLGIEVGTHKMKVMLEKNTRVPCKTSSLFTLDKNEQTVIPIRVYELENVQRECNNLLVSFNLTVPVRSRELSVTFEVDENGILNVTAIETKCQLKRTISITNSIARFSDKEFERMKLEEERLREAHPSAKSSLEDDVY